MNKLRDAYLNNNLIVFVGSGLSVPLQMPSWGKLIADLADAEGFSGGKRREIQEALDSYAYMEAIRLLMEETAWDEAEIQRRVAEYFGEAKRVCDRLADNNYKDLADMALARFFTTNYDEFIHDIAGGERIYFDEAQRRIILNQFDQPEYRKTAIPLHGDISRPEEIIFTEQSYKKLYENEDFTDFFERIRCGKTFLFIGFSFDDAYFQTLFQKVVGGFQMEHYILFSEDKRADIHVQENCRRYRVRALYYDAAAGHVEAIREVLEDITRVIRTPAHEIEVLPKKEPAVLPEAFQELYEKCGRAVENERLAELKELADTIRSMSGFGELDAKHRQRTGIYYLWYYSNLQEHTKAEEIMYTMDADPELYPLRSHAAVMYGQILWNARQWTQALAFLNGIAKETKILRLLRDVILVSQRFLPSAYEKQGFIPVYEETERTDVQKAEFAAAYQELKEKYVEDSFALKDLEEYEDRDMQKLAYQWLGIVAGQVFHEHRDAVEYLSRALMVEESRALYEELALNDLAIGEARTKYRKDAKQYEFDRRALADAKRCFAYVFAADDKDFLLSACRRVGSAYLQVLFDSRCFYEYEQFYERAGEFLPENYHKYIQKAQVDAEYMGEIPEEIQAHLTEDDRLWLELSRRESVSSMLNQPDTEKQKVFGTVTEEIEDRFGEYAHMPEHFQVMYRFALFSAGRYAEFAGLADSGDEAEACYLPECRGDVNGGQAAFEKLFRGHPDMSSMRELVNFYKRHGKKAEACDLFERILAEAYGFIGDRADVLRTYISTALNGWGDTGTALRAFIAHKDIFDSSDEQLELEEMLLPMVMDYSDWQRRIEFSRYMLTISPKLIAQQFYRYIFHLYIANMKYREAGKCLDEMRAAGVEVPEEWEHVQAIMMRPQKSRRYSRAPQHYAAGAIAGIKRSVNQLPWFGLYCFGRENGEVLIPMTTMIMLFAVGRQKELAHFSKVYVTYAGLLHLQSDLVCRETSLYRQILETLAGLANLELAACSMEGYVEGEKKYGRRYPEKIQYFQFLSEHREVTGIWGISQKGV
ncbi:MAG: SIR2 family protein [Blautia sp.]|nr:SIR2 family protein [Blautia sp.]